MPRQKDLKRLVRARMLKTGEAYTAARAQVVRKPRESTPSDDTVRAATPAPIAHAEPKDYAALAGMSDAVVKETTGCTWARWVAALDYHGASKLSHRQIAA
ncbi:MAG: hypothetical protein ABIP93_00090, partial [Gemmatimonadaceae bacterium]